MKRLIIPGLITFVIVLVATFPARVAYTLFAPTELQLSGIAGSIWSGTAVEGLAGGAYVRNIVWKLEPASLLSGDLGFTLSCNPMSGTINADLAVSPNGTLIFSRLNGNLPLDLVHPALQQSGVRGDINLEFDQLVIRNGVPVSAEGVVTINDLFAPDLSNSRIGDFSVTFQSTDGSIRGDIADLNGVLDVSGLITLNPDRIFTVVGLVAPTPQTPSSIINQLRFLGSANERGQHDFRFEGQL